VLTAQELGTSEENIRRSKKQLDDGILGSKVRQTAENKFLALKRLRKKQPKKLSRYYFPLENLLI
jgi:hypothetical protein